MRGAGIVIPVALVAGALSWGMAGRSGGEAPPAPVRVVREAPEERPGAGTAVEEDLSITAAASRARKVVKLLLI